MTAWDLWDYRNARLHAFAGPRELAKHQSCNSDIESEFSMGSESLPAASRYLIDSYTFDALKQASLVAKRQWLQSVWVARAACSLQRSLTLRASKPTTISGPILIE